jgi:EAL domain-containing protein (putative c-di-GMP-specific phosphodiesterase class I)
VIFGKLREIGFKIAIDDYPSGYNTLAFITRFKNIDIVKVDGMHVVNMYKTCHLCQHVDTCIQPFLRDTRVTDKWHCLKRLQEKYDLESLVQSFRFLKILYPNIIFFAERIEDESIYAFFNKIPSLIAGYQGYYFQLPEGISNVCDLLTEKQISDVFSELPTVTNVVPRKKERRTYIRVKKT